MTRYQAMMKMKKPLQYNSQGQRMFLYRNQIKVKVEKALKKKNTGKVNKVNKRKTK